MYQALYRKWRPKTFKEVIGQPQVTETLSAQVESGKLSHAYLFVGSRGTGKTTCARILARAVNCENPQNGNPCCKCAACLSILEGSAPEIVEIDAASNNGVDDVRALRDEAIYSPASLKKRVYIIDEVHMLSKPAFNALLKILEEPPAHLLFILATTELNKVPATILSRCQRFNFKRISSEDIASYLKYVAANEGLQISDSAAGLLARMAEGGMRDALSLLDQCAASKNIDIDSVNSVLGIASNAVIVKMLNGIQASDADSVVKSFETLWDEGKSPASVLKDLCTLIRDTLMIKVLKSGAESIISGNFDIQTLKQLSTDSETDGLISLLNSVINGLNTLSASSNPHIAAELCLISMCCSDTSPSLEARVKKLENIISSGDFSNYTQPEIVPEKQEYKKENPNVTYSLKSSISEEAAPAKPQIEVASSPSAQKKDEAPADKNETPVEVSETADNFEGGNCPVNSDTLSWKSIADILKPGLPIDMQMTIDNPDIVTGEYKNGMLKMTFEPGFAYSRFNTGEIIEDFTAKLKSSLNVDVKVSLQEHKDTPAVPQKSLNDLRSFGIINFVE